VTRSGTLTLGQVVFEPSAVRVTSVSAQLGGSSQAGETVMRELHELDGVAYVRFASVYRSFRDVHEFMRELEDLIAERRGKPRRRAAARRRRRRAS